MCKFLKSELALVLVLTILALAVRIYRLPELPPGLHYDEAANGMDVLDILAGRFSIFFERNNGREPLFIYLQAVSVALLGATPFALRLTSAVVGAFTVPAIYWMVKEAFTETRSDARWLAFWTALFVAFSYWHLSFSRIGYRAILLPLLASLAFAWFWRAWRKMENQGLFPWRDLILCGAFVGGCLYTYIAGRFVPILIVVVAIVGALLNGRSRAWFKRVILAVAVIGISALVVFAPLGLYFLTHPDSFLRRAADVSVFNPKYNQGNLLGTLTTSVIETAKMFAITGDPNWRHNPAGRPVLDPILAIWHGSGLILAVARWRSSSYLFVMAWFVVLSLPAVLTASALPHSLRALGMIPSVYLLPVLAMLTIGLRLFGQNRRWAMWVPLPFLLLSGFTSLHDYFATWQSNPESRYAFHTIFADTARVMNENDRSDSVWILPLSSFFFAPDSTNYTIDFLHRGRATHGLVLVDPVEGPAQIHKLVQGRQFACLIQWRDASQLPEGAYVYADSKRLISFLLNKHARFVSEDESRNVIYNTFELFESADYQVAQKFILLNASFNNRIKLTGIAYGHTRLSPQESNIALEDKRVRSGQAIWVALRWQAQSPIDFDLKTTLYLTDENGHLAGQVDDLLVSDRYPFYRVWEKDEPASTYHILPTLPATAPGRYKLYLGVYEDKTMQRYTITAPESSVGATSLFLGYLDITPAISTPSVSPGEILSGDTFLAPGLVLLGYDLASRTFNPGDRLSLALYWQSRTAPLVDYTVRVELRDTAGRSMVQQRSRPANGSYPTTSWQAGEVIRDWHDLEIPVTLPAGNYQLSVGLEVKNESVDHAFLGNIEVQGRPRQFAPPTIEHPMKQRVGTHIVFLGYDLNTSSVRAGDTVRLTLYWQALDKIAHSYTVFTHLLGTDGQLWGQQDNLPGQGTLPTTRWVPGEYITDSYEIKLKPEILPGEYRIEIGMYDSTTGARLSILGVDSQSQSDHILLDVPISVK